MGIECCVRARVSNGEVYAGFECAYLGEPLLLQLRLDRGDAIRTTVEVRKGDGELRSKGGSSGRRGGCRVDRSHALQKRLVCPARGSAYERPERM